MISWGQYNPLIGNAHTFKHTINPKICIHFVINILRVSNIYQVARKQK